MPTQTRLTSQERREAIIRSAIELFSERGFQGTTTRELAKACGVSEPTLYQHFPSKSDLYSAIIDACCDFEAEPPEEYLRIYAERRDDEGYFREVARVVREFYEEHASFIRLLQFSALERHELAPMFLDRLKRPFLDETVHYIQRRMDEGAFHQGIPTAISGFLLGSLDNILKEKFVFGQTQCSTTENLDEWIEQLLQVFLRGIKVEP
jgi:TetR/AcrR family transcriptional regulator